MRGFEPEGTARIMINWGEQKIFCNTCGTWVNGHWVMIDGRHDLTGDITLSDHTVWDAK
jgi:hypothetical protein